MPSVAVSPSTRAQSWEGWYLRSVGGRSGNELLLSDVEGLGADLGRAGPAADVDLEARADARPRGGEIRHADAHAERRRERAAGHLATADDGIAGARDAGDHDHEGHQQLRRPGLAHPAHRLGADEAGLLATRPAEAGRDRIVLLVEVVAIEVKASLQAQGVAGAQAGRLGARGHQRVPQ